MVGDGGGGRGGRGSILGTLRWTERVRWGYGLGTVARGGLCRCVGGRGRWVGGRPLSQPDSVVYFMVVYFVDLEEALETESRGNLATTSSYPKA